MLLILAEIKSWKEEKVEGSKLVGNLGN